MSEYFPYSPPPRGNYFVDDSGYMGEMVEQPAQPNIESPISIKDIGQSITEGSRFGSLVQTSQQAIKFGTQKIEMALGMGGGHEPVGAENYGNDARQALRELARANQVEFVSTHSPTQVGNLSGFNPQQGSFSEHQRQEGLEEVKKAIKFAGDVAQGGAVVVHTGEHWRDMSDQNWSKDNISVEENWDKLTPAQKKYVRDKQFREFKSYPSEDADATHYLVDRRTGKLIQDVKKNVRLYEPAYKGKYDKKGNWYYVDKDGNPIKRWQVFEYGVPLDEEGGSGVKVEEWKWNDFEKMADAYRNENNKPMTAAEMYMRARLHSQKKQSKGMGYYHSRGYEQVQEQINKANERLKNLERADEDNISEEEKISMLTNMQNEFGTGAEEINKAIREGKKPSEFLKNDILGTLNRRREEMEALSTHYKTSEKEVDENMYNIMSVDQYAQNKSINSYAELGINAMEESQRPEVKKPIFVAPENIFPEMGYASHPDEIISLVQRSRDRMIDMLTKEKIEDPSGALDENGETRKIINPYYKGISKKKAEEEAKEHIKMTLDTQHLGMWWKHFQPLPGETYDQRKERFNKWYKKMVQKLHDKEVIGHVHLVDSMGSGHNHLPAGQGNLPVYEAIEYLQSKGYKGTIISEAHGEEANFGQGRIVSETWKHFGSPIKSYGAGGANPSFGSVKNGYFSNVQSPYFIFGGYVPSNEWKLWSEVPFE